MARNWVEPPFDIGRYPSPLAGFRKYVDLQGRPDRAANVYDKTLLDVEGVAPGTRVRFATMDRYDGMVWGATDNALPGPADDSFQRVSSTIDNPVDGRRRGRRSTITLGEGWTGVWLPTVGRPAVDDVRDRRRARQGRGLPLQPRHLDRRRPDRPPARATATPSPRSSPTTS